jgi:type VI secretion system protein ImpM
MNFQVTPSTPMHAAQPIAAPGPAAGIPGWHGKLPTLGDFASRRLDPDFIEAWDAWLAGGLMRLQQADSEGWLAAYLASPSWRFWLLPGALPGPAGRWGWAGVLMPSVDRVGRYFPLTLALPLPVEPSNAPALAALWGWLAQLDALAADALHEDWSADQLESRLATLALPGAPTTPVLDSDPAAHLVGLALQQWTQAARGQSWWQACPEGEPSRLWCSAGLPGDLGPLFGPMPAMPGERLPSAPGGAAPSGAAHRGRIDGAGQPPA